MKRITSSLLMLLFAISSYSQSPEKMSYQAVVRNSGNALVSNSTVGLRISILQGSPAGSVVYSEVQTPTANSNGLISIEIGGGTGFSSIDWSAGTYFIKTETDPAGGTSYTISGTTQLLSVPYALHAKTAESISTTAASPMATAKAATGVTSSTAILNGTVNGKGFSLTNYFIWGPTLPLGNMEALSPLTGSADVSISAGISGLQAATTYYYSVVATNAVNTTLSNQLSFTTLNSAPVLTTTPAFAIMAFSGASGGTISYNGGAAVTARGICYSTSQLPTTANSIVTAGTGNGGFVANMTGLLHATTYYVRAYATNSVGTSYGNQVSFTTQNGVVTLTTAAVTGISGTVATSGGTITSEGGDAVTVRGLCWSYKDPNPTLASGFFTTDGAGPGTFVSGLTGLDNGLTYWIRSYATNSIGTTYGNVVTFFSTIVSIGDTYAGGVVFYIDATGQHGLVCAPTDQGTATRFYDYNGISWFLVGGTGTALGSGNANTIALVAAGPLSTAAIMCSDLVLNTYSDWYLPSKDELNLMYQNLKVAGLGGLANYYYWSSSEFDNTRGWCHQFNGGGQTAEFKNYAFYVRAVRNF